MASPAGVSDARRLPWRTNTRTPSSSSSWRTCLLMPGCEVCSAKRRVRDIEPVIDDRAKIAELLKIQGNLTGGACNCI